MSPISQAQPDSGSSCRPHAPTRSRRAAPGRTRKSARRREQRCLRSKPACLAVHLDAHGRRRELVAVPGRGGSLLVIDRDAATLRDRLLLAHLAVDEPPVNAMLVCRDYLSRTDRPRPRQLRADDLLANPPGQVREALDLGGQASAVYVDGQIHRLCPVRGADGKVQLRWSRDAVSRLGVPEPVGLRELVGALESYEPMRTMTAVAIHCHREDLGVSIRHLQDEYRRMCTSPVVLNRALREAVVRATRNGELTMSEIALRCGVVKRDRRGGCSGETSWLARRVGLMAEGGASHVAPWIHSDVLALIAREGLRMSPREVEVP